MYKTRHWKTGAVALACVLYGALAPSAMAAPVVISNGFIKAGVGDRGTLGSGGTAPPGILYDSSGTGTYGVNDFLTPGTPFEGFYVTASGGYSQSSNNAGPTSFLLSSPTLTSGSGATWTSTSIDGTLGVTNTYSLTNVGGSSVIAISTTLTALTIGLTGVEFLRTIDPDPDLIAFSTFFTNNTVLSPSQACATGTQTGQTICIASNSPFIHQAGVSGPFWSTSPAAYLGGVNAGNGDYAIGMGFRLGNFALGESKTVCYSYVLGKSLAAASEDTECRAVPEPGSLALAMPALAAAAWLRRRKPGLGGAGTPSRGLLQLQ